MADLSKACKRVRSASERANVALEVVLARLGVTRKTFLSWESGGSAPRTGCELIIMDMDSHAKSIDMLVKSGVLGVTKGNKRNSRKVNNERYKAEFL
jgi:hypothetical protein